MQQRRKFSEEFKREAFSLTRLPDVNVSQIAQNRRELASGSKQPFPGAGVSRDQTLLALKREFARVKKERVFLRDAATFFAKESSYTK